MSKIFTSFVAADDNNSCRSYYIEKLIPLWVKINKRWCDDLTIITNIPDEFKELGVNVKCIGYEDSFYGKNPKKYNPMSSQPACWLNFLNSLNENDTALYLDPDAFLCNDTLLKLCEDVEDHMLHKKIIKYGDSDAGVALLRNTANTRQMLKNVEITLNDPHISCNIEHYYDKHFRGNKQYYIPWKKAAIYLHGNICGNPDKIDCIHGCHKRAIKGQLTEHFPTLPDNVLQIAKQTQFEFDIIEAFHVMYEKECIRNY